MQFALRYPKGISSSNGFDLLVSTAQPKHLLKDDGAINPRSEATPENHTMGHSLPQYLKMRIHQIVHEQRFERITVVGGYHRSHPSIIFNGEKLDKPFNWQRPTATIVDNHLRIECFPGHDHVEHYAEMIAAYLTLCQRETDVLTPPSRVFFVSPSQTDTQRALQATNIVDFPVGVDTVVLGLVHRMPRLTGPVDWAGNEPFYWVLRRFNGRLVAFVGFRPAFWGNIAGELVRYLATQRHAREVLYCGKLGGVRRGLRPNTWLANGGRSYVHGNLVEWDNVLAESVATVANDCTVVGTHVTLASVVQETKDWLAQLPSEVDFVDPEIGTMAQAAVESGIRYGYCHIISDNVAEKYDEDLSNERQMSVLMRRAKLYEAVERVLCHHFTRNR